MKEDLIKYLNKNYDLVEIVYLARTNMITKRRVKILQINDDSFSGYCYLRHSTRTFRYENILAFVPRVIREEAVV